MSAEQLITQHLNLWASAIKRKSSAGRGSSSKVELYGIKKLRELILELAVRGLLVPQDPNDEPASELLKRIAAEKARLVKEGKIKKGEPAPKIENAEKPFELPPNWEWSRFIEISANIHYGYTASSDESIESVRLLRITDIQNDSVDWNSVPGCEIEADKIDQYQLIDDDILIARTGGTIGKSYLVQGITVCAVFASYLIRVRHLMGMSARYKKLYLGSKLYWKQLYAKSMGTGQPNVNGESLKGLVVPVPPIAEQHRIVAKVDELMALCDQLEQQSDASLAAHQTLVATLLSALTSAAARPEPVEGGAASGSAQTAFDEAWQRIADHFDTLFTTEESIDQLKQTILQLAVMGKLVPQDPNDEPANELLKRVFREIKKPKAFPPIENEEYLLPIPSGWNLARLGDIFEIVYGKGLPTTELTETGFDVFGANGIIGKYREYNYEDIQLLVSCRGAYSGKANISPPMCFITSNTLVLKNSWKSLSLKFFYYALTIADKEKIVTGSAQPQVTTTNIDPFVVAVPPLAEQHRIVAKVDELMALCDQLKAGLSAAQTTQLQLADAMIEQALH